MRWRKQWCACACTNSLWIFYNKHILIKSKHWKKGILLCLWLSDIWILNIIEISVYACLINIALSSSLYLFCLVFPKILSSKMILMSVTIFETGQPSSFFPVSLKLYCSLFCDFRYRYLSLLHANPGFLDVAICFYAFCLGALLWVSFINIWSTDFSLLFQIYLWSMEGISSLYKLVFLFIAFPLHYSSYFPFHYWNCPSACFLSILNILMVLTLMFDFVLFPK